MRLSRIRPIKSAALALRDVISTLTLVIVPKDLTRSGRNSDNHSDTDTKI